MQVLAGVRPLVSSRSYVPCTKIHSLWVVLKQDWGIRFCSKQLDFWKRRNVRLVTSSCPKSCQVNAILSTARVRLEIAITCTTTSPKHRQGFFSRISLSEVWTMCPKLSAINWSSANVHFHWREPPQVSFLSQQMFCRDKNVFIATKMVVHTLQTKSTDASEPVWPSGKALGW